MNDPLSYPAFPPFEQLCVDLKEYARLKTEAGADQQAMEQLLLSVKETIRAAILQIRQMPEEISLAKEEPNELDLIHAKRPFGKRILWPAFDEKRYQERLAGALMGRMAGCTLGAPVEFWPVDEMRDWAEWIGDPFPPENYWSAVPNPHHKRYEVSPCQAYTRSGLDGVPVDDDITYTLLGLLIAEECGFNFSVRDVGRCWLSYLPYACTAEAVALKNLKNGFPAESAADIENPYVQWIGADIRSDPWGYLAPGLPEQAATLAYHDAFLTHRRNGIYGAMYFSSVIAAAFAYDEPVEALEAGLCEIPENCLLSQDVRWALEKGKSVKDYRDARRAVEERFGDMSGVHTNLNACLTIFGLLIGKDDFTRCIGETVAMGYDNDCTAATAGSIFGAAKGLSAVPDDWYKPFRNKIHTYLIGHPVFAIDDVLNRFCKLAAQQF